jgi:hypothetical protein
MTASDVPTPDLPPSAAQEQPAPLADKPAVGVAKALLDDLRELDDDLVSGSLTSSSISVLRRDLRLAVRSFLGFTLTLSVPGPAVSVAINVVDQPIDTDQAGDDLAVQLPPQANGFTASLTLYAADESAFDDLRGDLADLLDRPATTLSRSPETPSRTLLPGVTGLQDFLAVYRSVGVLIASGYTQEHAFTELVRRAHGRSAGLADAARAVLTQVSSATAPRAIAVT